MVAAAKRPHRKPARITKPDPVIPPMPVDEHALVAEICKESFSEFVKEFWDCIPGIDPLEWNWLLEYLCDELQAVAEPLFRGENKKHDLLNNCPTGTGKSAIHSILFPAWVWTRMPRARIAGCSYAESLAMSLALKCRDVVKSKKYQRCFPYVQIREDQDSKGFFMTTAGGERRAVGTLGMIHGTHYHFICFPGETMVETDRGRVPIGQIVGGRLPVRVLAYDHATGTPRWRRILKYELHPGREVCRVCFSNGAEFEATHDHPVYVRGRGYIFVSELLPGDVVISAVRLSSVRESISAKAVSCQGGRAAGLFVGVQRRRSQSTQPQVTCQVGLRPLRQDPPTEPRRSPQTGKTRLQIGVLFQRLPSRSQEEQDHATVQGVQEEVPSLGVGIRHPSLLLAQVQGHRLAGRQVRRVQAEGQSRVPRVFRPVATPAQPSSIGGVRVLLAGMCQPASFYANEWTVEPEFYSRKSGQAVLREVPADVRGDSTPREAAVLPVSPDGESRRQSPRRTPRRLRQAQRHEGQSRGVVSVLSRADAREPDQSFALGEAVVASVELAVRIPETVYNLQVAEDHNYFAEGVLVHNCIDDPIDPNRVVSAAEVANTNYWIRHTLSGRKTDKRKSVTILVMQRLSQDDPTADMIEMNGIDYVRWNRIPATADYEIRPPELARYYTDGFLDPIRLPQEILDKEHQKLSDNGFAAQYGQDPVPAGGSTFKTSQLRFGRPPEKFKIICRAWDKAATPPKAGKLRGPKFTVGALIGLDDFDRFWVLDVVRVRRDSFARERLIKRTAYRDRTRYGNVLVAVEVEPGSGGIDSALGTVRRLLGLRVRMVKASGSKEVRADEFSVAVNGGLVYLPAEMRQGSVWVGWAKEFVDELAHFPVSTYMDQVDAGSLAFNQLVAPRARVGTLRKRGRARGDVWRRFRSRSADGSSAGSIR